MCSGYGCADHFLEADTYRHSWEVLAELLRDSSLHDILIDTGMYPLPPFTIFVTLKACLSQEHSLQLSNPLP